MERILIVEDERSIARFVELELTHEGYTVTKAYNGREGLELLKSQPFDLVLLDIMMPELSGMEVLRRLRQFSEIPAIMLTARDAVYDKVSGLDQGADDYITKPFAIEELLARIRVALRKRSSAAEPSSALCVLDVNLNPETRLVEYKGEEIPLTKKEFDLLHYLMENKNHVLTREQILENVWGYEYAGETNIVDVYVRYVRAKLDASGAKGLISTIRGVGYAVRDA